MGSWITLVALRALGDTPPIPLATRRALRGNTQIVKGFGYLALLLPLLFNTSCAPVAIVSAGAAGAEMSMQDRTVGRTLDDVALKAKVSKKFFDADINDLFKNTEVDVIEARVFLTGSVNTTETAIKAVTLAWQVDGVREVINELQVDDKNTIVDYARDAWIQRQIGAQMLFTKGIRSTNYTIECVNGVVYLMGIAQNEAELNKVTTIASRTKYVKQVVSHAVLKNDPRRS